MPACDVFVSKRPYGKPGPCQSLRGVKIIKVGDTPIRACAGHQRHILGGGQPTLVRRRR